MKGGDVVNGGDLEGIVLVCDGQAVVKRILYNGMGFGEDEVLNRPLISLVEQSALEKTLNFLTSIRSETAVFNWRMAIPLPGELRNLFFSGIMLGSDILIIAAVNRTAQFELYDHFALQGGVELDASVRARVEEIRGQGSGDEDFFDDFTRLNNELANLHRELHKKNIELEKLDQLKNQFLGMAAHDLRSPLVTVDMYSSYLMDELAGRLSDEEMECLSIIRSSSTYMLDLVNDLLDIARIESGKLQLRVDGGNIHDLVLHVIKLNRAPASRKKLDIVLEADDDLPAVRFDTLRLEQVMHNLLNNAVKFSYRESSIMVGIHRKDEHVLLTVEDKGTGMAEEQSKNLFSMFEHARTRGTEGEKSTGLGLAIAQKIVLAHGGSIWAESEVGKGTTLYVKLPVAGP